MNKLFPYLTYMGAIPFIACALFLSFDITSLPLLGSVETILSVYSLVIATFLSGSYWGVILIYQVSLSRVLPILTNMIAIYLWVSFLILSFKVLTIVFISIFILLLLIDYRLYQINLFPQQYFQMRCYISTIVIVALIVSAIVS